jgi:hypothetical protein
MSYGVHVRLSATFVPCDVAVSAAAADLQPANMQYTLKIRLCLYIGSSNKSEISMQVDEKSPSG